MPGLEDNFPTIITTLKYLTTTGNYKLEELQEYFTLPNGQRDVMTVLKILGELQKHQVCVYTYFSRYDLQLRFDS